MKSQPNLRSEKRNVFPEKVNMIALSANEDKKKIQSIDSKETYVYGTRKHLVSKVEEIKCNNIIKWYKKWLWLYNKKNMKEHNPNWP